MIDCLTLIECNPVGFWIVNGIIWGSIIGLIIYFHYRYKKNEQGGIKDAK